MRDRRGSALWRGLTQEQRFWSHVDTTGECWVWIASTRSFGYGHLHFDGCSQAAHRVSWQLHNGPIPDGLLVLHRCDNPRCVNPDHLFLGTDADNVADKLAKGRGVWGETVGRSKLTSDQVLAIDCDPRAHSAIAEEYGLAHSTVSRIKNRRRWKRLFDNHLNPQHRSASVA